MSAGRWPAPDAAASGRARPSAARPRAAVSTTAPALHRGRARQARGRLFPAAVSGSSRSAPGVPSRTFPRPRASHTAPTGVERAASGQTRTSSAPGTLRQRAPGCGRRGRRRRPGAARAPAATAAARRRRAPAHERRPRGPRAGARGSGAGGAGRRRSTAVRTPNRSSPVSKVGVRAGPHRAGAEVGPRVGVADERERRAARARRRRARAPGRGRGGWPSRNWRTPLPDEQRRASPARPGSRRPSTRRTTAASRPSPALKVNQRSSARPEPDPAAAVAARSACSSTLVASTGVRGQAERAGEDVGAAARARRRARARPGSARRLEQPVDDLVDRAVAAERHDDVQAVDAGLRARARRRARGRVVSTTSSLTSLDSAEASTSRVRGVVAVAIGLTTSSARMRRRISARLPSTRVTGSCATRRAARRRSRARAWLPARASSTPSPGCSDGRRTGSRTELAARCSPSSSALLLLPVARGLAPGRRWARSPAVVVQLFCLPVGYGARAGRGAGPPAARRARARPSACCCLLAAPGGPAGASSRPSLARLLLAEQARPQLRQRAGQQPGDVHLADAELGRRSGSASCCRRSAA